MPLAETFPRSPCGGAGVVIAEHAAHVVMLRPDGDAFRLTHTEVGLPPGCLRCGHVVDASALREALSSVAMIVGDLPTWLGIFPDDTLIQTFDLGDVSVDAAERELESLAAGFVDYGYVGGWEIRSTPSGESALTVAIPGAHVQRYAAAARLSGLVLAGIECTAQALVRGLVHGSTPRRALAGLAVAELGGSRLAAAWLGDRAVSGGWLGPVLPGRTPVTGRLDVHPAVLDLIAPGARAGFADGAAGWPASMGFVQGVTGRIERLIAAVDTEPVAVPAPSRLVSDGGAALHGRAALREGGSALRGGGSVALRAEGAGLVDPAAWGLALVASGFAVAPVDLLAAAGGSAAPAVEDRGPVDLSPIAQLSARLAALPTADLPIDGGEVTWAPPVRATEQPPVPAAPLRPPSPESEVGVGVEPGAATVASPQPAITISFPPLDRAGASTAMRLPDPASFWTSRIGTEASRVGRAPSGPAAAPAWRAALDALSAPYPAGSPYPPPSALAPPSPSLPEPDYPPRPSAARRAPVRQRVAQLLGRSLMASSPADRVHEEAS